MNQVIKFSLSMTNWTNTDYPVTWLQNLKIRYWFLDDAPLLTNYPKISNAVYNIWQQWHYPDNQSCTNRMNGLIATGTDIEPNCITLVPPVGGQDSALEITLSQLNMTNGSIQGVECCLNTRESGPWQSSLGFDATITKVQKQLYYIDQGNDWSFGNGQNWPTALITVYYPDENGVYREMFGQEPPQMGQYDLHVACGKMDTIIQNGNTEFKRDRYYETGVWGLRTLQSMYCSGAATPIMTKPCYTYTNCNAYIMNNGEPVSDPNEQALYQTVMQAAPYNSNGNANYAPYNGPVEYKFDNVPNGTYNITFHFAEIDPSITGAGQDVMNIYINDSSNPINTSPIDVYSQVGSNTEYTWTVPAQTITNGQIKIDYDSSSLCTNPNKHGCLAAIDVDYNQNYPFLGMSPKIGPYPYGPTWLPQMPTPVVPDMCATPDTGAACFVVPTPTPGH